MPDSISETLKIGGMTCVSCERRIQETLQKIAGVEEAKVSYGKGTARLRYDPTRTSRDVIVSSIENLHYSVVDSKQPKGKVANNKNTSAAGILLIILAAYLLLRQMGLTNILNVFPQAEAGMGYGMLFVIGLLTSVHCVAMCGGINMSQCIPAAANADSKLAALRPSFLYNLGRVLSYTAVGAIVGALGSVISFSGSLKGIVQLVAGVFMVVMGINMLGVFPWLRRFNPRLPSFLTKNMQGKKNSNSPLVVGLFNGLMPCGPLQAMQIYALSTGDPLKGALSMLLFSLGTVPLMFGLGALSSVLSKKFTNKMMTVGAVLVVVLGISMFNNGLTLSGFAFGATPATGGEVAETVNGIQIVETSLSSGRYSPITVTVGTPVQWNIRAEQGTINGCNNRLYIPEYGIEKSLEVGDNIIEFVPETSGTFTYSCWMGMIRSTITVTEADGTVVGGSSGGVDVFEIPDGYELPSEEIAVGVIIEDKQYVSIDMESARFNPAVIVVQNGIETEWRIYNDEGLQSDIIFPVYGAQLILEEGENVVYLLPVGDFDFFVADGSYFGYVAVVEDITNVDLDEVRERVREYNETLGFFDDSYWTQSAVGSSTGSSGGGVPSCH